MKCLLSPSTEKHHSSRKLFRCQRAGCDGKMLENPHGDPLHPPKCKGWPLLAEHAEWLKLFSAAFGITGGIHFAKYILWRAKGSPLDQLPPGVPRPELVRPVLTDAEMTELFPNEDPTLLGNRIKALTTAIGIPTCGGCESRRKWINNAHQWLKDNVLGNR